MATYKTTLSLILLSILVAPLSRAAVIVGLDPSLARFDSLIHADDGAGGFNAGNPDATQNAFGLTLNATFTPAAGDLDSATAAVNIIEVGGDANGSGLYLLDGQVHFISKMNGGGGDALSTLNDLDFASGNNMIGVKSGFGALTAGVEYSVAVLFDPIDTSPSLQIGLQPSGGALYSESFAILGVGAKTNWDGDNSTTAFRGDPPNAVGNLGGSVISTNANTAYAWHENNINGNAFEGTQGQALYWTQDNAQLIPEPSSALLILLGSLGLWARRRR